MIPAAKGNLKKGAGKNFLLWGYLICAASFAHFIIVNFATSQVVRSDLIWIGVTILGIVISLIMGFRDHGKWEVTTYVGSISLHIWSGFMVCLIAFLILAQGEAGWYTYSIITLLYTFALYISTAVLRLRWMYLSVVVCVICLLLYRVFPFNYYPLLMAVVMLAGNIIPGHFLNYKAKRENNV
jgi:hypothetical protein